MKNSTALILLIGTLVLYYLAVVWSTGFFADPEFFLFRFAPDSLDYLAVSDWLFRGAENTMIERRTFLYPLCAGLSRWIGGSLGIWIMQMSFWVFSAALFYFNLRALEGRRGIRLFILAAFCLVWTPILLSLMVLAESLAFPFFSLAAFFLIFMHDRLPVATRYLAVLICAGVLSVVKPNYLPLFYAVLVTLALLWVTGRVKFAWSAFLIAVILAFLPTIAQIGFHRRATGVADTSNIGYNVMEMTFYPQVLAKIVHRPFIDVRPEVEKAHPSMKEMVLFELQHPWISFTCFLRNLEENTREVFHIRPEPYPFEALWRRKLNDVFYFLHILFLIPTGILLWRGRHLREESEISLLLLAMFFWVPLLTTGISFWAADRYSVPMLPIWPLLYTMVAHRFSLPAKSSLRQTRSTI